MSNTRVHQTVSTPSSVKTTRRKLYLAMLTASQFMVAGHVLAAPEGGQVVGGAGSIDQTGSKTTIHQETERMAIDWKSFDVKADERVQFVQPKSTSVALNRVLSNRGSEILGRIDANGKVILVNPNGIVFGQGSQINVGGIMASGLNIDPNDFMNGEFTLTAIEGTEGKVINSGIINAATGGSVTLLGKEVKNEGLISAHLGSVNLAAGKAAVVTFDPSGMVGVKITQAVLQNDLGLDPAVINSGEIIAQGGRILISASVSQDIFSQAVNHGGMNQANSVVMNADGSFTLGAGADVINTGSLSTSNTTGDAGQIVLLGDNVSNSGNILANSNAGSAGQIELNSTDTTQLTQTAKISAQTQASGVGGDIKILGNKVGLFDSSAVNASGINGGGQILVGGDETGKNKSIRNADFIYLSENSSVKTDAVLNGDGGKLITFASDTARIYGSLSARGGSEGGNGGFIETSGLKGFEILNTPDIGATIGYGGSWLIDPFDITITDSNNFDGAGTFANPYRPKDTNSRINITTLNAALINNATVYVRTNVSGTGSGNITIDPGSDWTYNLPGAETTSTLRLEAFNDILIKENIAPTGSSDDQLNFILKANYDETNGSTKTGSGAGKIVFTAGKTIETNGGYFTATGVSFDSSLGTINTYGDEGGGDIDITATGDVDLGNVVFNYDYHNAQEDAENLLRIGSISVTSGGSVTLHNSINFNDTGGRIEDGASAFAGSSTDDKLSQIKIIAADDININGEIADINNVRDARDAMNIYLYADSLVAGSVISENTGNAALTGAININQSIYTAGGNFTAVANTFSMASGKELNTNLGNISTSSGGGVANFSYGGDVSITAASSIALRKVETDSVCTSGVCTGNFELIKRNAAATVTQNSGTTLNIFGTSTFDLGTSAVNSALTLNNTGNIFTGNILFTSAGNVNLLDTTAINLGTSTVNGSLALNAGGNITDSGTIIVTGLTTLTASNHTVTLNSANNNFSTINVTPNIAQLTLNDIDALTVGAVITNGGSLDITAAGGITLNGNLSTNGNSAVTGGQINLRNNVTLGADVVMSSAGATTGGDIIFSGTVTGAHNLSLTGKAITFNGDVGTSGTHLGALAINSTANVNSTSIRNDFFIESLTANALNFYADTINTVNTSGVGGLVSLGNGSTEIIVTGDINTSTGSVAANNGGAITLTGRDISTGSLTALGALTGLGGAVNINATNGGAESIAIGGDINANSGVGGTQGSVNLTLGATGTSGAVTLTGTSFISSNITVTGDSSSDTLTGLNTASTWTTVANNNGTIRDSVAPDKTITFIGFEKLAGSGAADIFNLNHNISQSVNGGNGENIFQINFASLDAIVTGGDNSDEFTIGALLTKGTFNGGLGADTFIIDIAGAPTATIDGGTGTDTIVGFAQPNTWNLNATAVNENLNTNLIFSSVENVTGNSLVDTFTITGTLSGTRVIDAKGDDDIVNVAGSATVSYTGTFSFFGITDAEVINSSGGGTLTATSDSIDSITWTLSGTESSVTDGTRPVKFTGFTALTGGTGSDTFTITDNRTFTGVISGGTGANTLNLIDISNTNPYTVNVGGTGSSLNITGINTINGNGNALSKLIVAAGTNTWTLFGGADQGRITSSIDTAFTGTLNFSGFPNLTGGTGVDTFDFSTALDGSVTGEIDGGDLDDILKGRSADTDWTLSGVDEGSVSLASSANYINSFTSIQNVVGSGAFADSFLFSDGASVKSANGGVGAGVNTVDLSAINSATLLTLTLGAANTFGVSNISKVIGNGSDLMTLAVVNGTNTWKIYDFDGTSLSSVISDGINDGTLNEGTAGAVSFVNFKNLQGGTGNDTFDFSMFNSGKIEGQIDGGAGASESNNLMGNDTDNTWRITGTNAGSVETLAGAKYANFTHIQNLLGGLGVDNFAFSDGASVVSAGGGGGTGVNAIDLSAFLSSTVLTLTLGASNTFAATNISKVIGNGSNNLTLAVAAGTNTWTIFDVDGNAGSSVISDGINDGTVTSTTAFSGTTQFINFKNLQGGTGTDTFDLTGANATLTGKITGGGATDEIKARNLPTQWNITGTGNGSLVYSGNTTTFESVEKLTGSDAIDRFTFVASGSDFILTGGDDTSIDVLDLSTINQDIELTLGGTSISGIAVTGIEDIRVNTNRTNTLTGYGGGSAWTINDENGGVVRSGTLETFFAGFSKLVGANNQTDTFTFVTGGSITGSIDGGTGLVPENKIIGLNTNNIWTITNTNRGNISVDGGASYLTLFSNIQSLTGGAGNDTFDFSSVAIGKIDGTIDGALGTTNKIIGRNTASTWDLTAADTAQLKDTTIYINNFKNINALQGSGNVDTFNINYNFTGSIKGGANNDVFNINTIVTSSLDGESDNNSFVFIDGSSVTGAIGGTAVTNTVDLSQLTTDFLVTLNGTSMFGVTNVNTILGSVARSFTLAVASGNNTWTVTSPNSGTVASTLFPTINFSNFKNLTGGSGNDTFDFSTALTGTIDGTLDGGTGGVNTLTGRNAINIWDITAIDTAQVNVGATAYINNFKNMNVLQGGSETNTFNINHAFAGTINGGDKADIFSINQAVTGTLFGGDGDDSFTLGATGSATLIDGGTHSLTGSDSLTGRNTATTWQLPATGNSTLTDTGLYASFTNIQTLRGGSEANTFNINQAFSGAISGGINTDTFNINQAVTGTLFGGDGDDIFILGTTGSALLINGGTHTLTGSDSLTGRNTATTWQLPASGNGTLTDTGLYASFTNVQTLRGGSATNIFNIDRTFIGAINGGANTDTFNINQAVTGTLFGGAGDDSFIVGASGSASLIDGGTHTLASGDSLTGRNTTTTWQLSSVASSTLTDSALYASFNNIQTLKGGTNTDTLIGYSQSNAWRITGANLGNITSSTLVVNFTDMENITGNVDVDSFVFADNSANITGLIDGGTSATANSVIDTLNLQNLTSDVIVELGDSANPILNTNLNVKNIETITAKATTSNTLIGASHVNPAVGYSWVINAGDTGTVSVLGSSNIELATNFVNFGNLRGGTNSDAFEVNAQVTGSIHGGDGTDVIDSIDYSKILGVVEITLGGDGSFGGTGVDGIEGIKGNNDGINNTTYMSSIGINAGTNIWALGAFGVADGINDGQITIASKVISFENFNIINGGSEGDTFNLTASGQFIGTINGGNGTNVFNASASALPQMISLSGVGANTTYLTGFNTITGSTNAASELIGVATDNTWTVNSFSSAAKAAGTVNGIAFSRFSRLTGSSSTNDTVDLTFDDRDISVGLGATTIADLIIKNIEQVNASATKNNTLLAETTIANIWDIDEENEGKLNTLFFTGFANLTGGALVDTFKFLNGAAKITGIINAGDGADTVDLLAAGRAVNVNLLNPALDNRVANNINVINAETINASSNFINTLTAGDLVNSWNINATNSGDLNKSLTSTGIVFTNFNNLIGGSLDDTFTFTSAGSVTGYVDGKAHTLNGGDVVNLSALNDVDILLSSTQVGYRNIESYVGNAINSILRGDTTDNTWVLSGVQNSGSINGTTFVGFTTLYGGSGKDTFNITGDSVSGSINGEGGDDSLAVNVVSGTTGNINFNGGGDTNTITVIGGDAGYQAKHIALGAAGGQINYSNINNVSYNISYSSITTLNDNLVAEKLTLNDTQNADIFTFKNNGYSLVNSPAVFYSNKNNLLIATSDANDQVIVDGVIRAVNDLTIRNATVTATANGSVKANSLSLTGTAAVGSLAQRLNVDIANLSVSAAQGNIYLQAINNVNIAEFSTNSLFDFVSNGNLTSGVKLTSIGDVNITTTGDIVLDKENSLSGKLHLLAGNNINLRNDSITNLNGLTAQVLTVNSSGAINGNDSPVKVTGLASFSSGGDINLNNAANDFNSLTIGSANNAYITDLNFITFTDVTTARDFVTHSAGVATSVAINAVNVSLDAGQGLATLANITAAEDINIVAQGIVTNGNLTAATIDLNGMASNVTLNGKLDTTGKQTITVAGKTITQNAGISGGGLVSLQASENMIQNAEIKSAGDIAVNAGSDISMGSNATTHSTNGNISYSGANLSMMALDAINGDVVLKATGAIEDMNADALNITAKRFVADAVSGIGVTDAGLPGLFDTAVTELSLSNESGSIGIQNTGSVTIDRLRTNGDITLSNMSGDVVLDNSTGSPFVRTISDNPAETNALTSFGTTNANYNLGTLTIDVAAGSLTASGAAKKSNPDITAFNASLTASNYIGDTRPLVVYVKNTLYVYADIFSWKPLYGFDIAPVEDLSTYKGNIADIVGAGAEQLVQVETLDEVNPAIFTGVRNYVYDDIAILMPADQRYDDKDSEE